MKKFLALTLLFAMTNFSPAAPLTIENKKLSVRVGGDAFTVQSKPTGKTVLHDGKLGGTGRVSKKTVVADKVFGVSVFRPSQRGRSIIT